MSSEIQRLQVLLVEDDPDDLTQYERDFPDVFSSHQIETDIHSCSDFDEAIAHAANPLYRYDLIVSDTYKGPTRNRDAQVLKMVDSYRGIRFCPLVVYSSGVKPNNLKETAFIVWADKGKSGDIERAIEQILKTNIPQLARKLHDELDRLAGSYLWEFLETKWDQLESSVLETPEIVERLIRRRAATQIGDLDFEGDNIEELKSIASSEYYLMPPVSDTFKLGHILRHKKTNEVFVMLTPHCYLEVQENTTEPRAEYVQLIRAIEYREIVGRNQDKDPRLENNKKKKLDKMRRIIQSPAQIGKPAGRYWFLPGFLDIPDSFCDFLQVKSVKFKGVKKAYEPLAVLDTPFAEAFQSCFTSFYASVGLPNFNPQDFIHLASDDQQND